MDKFGRQQLLDLNAPIVPSLFSFVPSSRSLLVGLVVSSLATCLVLLVRTSDPVNDLNATVSANSASAKIDAETERKIVAFCSACHAMPLASSFARDSWHAEVMQGYHFYAKSGRTDLQPSAPHLAISYFQSKAPLAIELPEQADNAQASRISFLADRSSLDKSTPLPPAVAHLKWLPVSQDSSGLLVACDMRLGTIRGIDTETKWATFSTKDRVGHPCHAEPCDLNRDGQMDLVIGDLGSFAPDDHDRGRVLWIQGNPSGDWTARVLMEKLGRISDVRPVDLDLDGDLDLVVAEFGWHTTGGILVLRNETKLASEPTFHAERIYGRSGTVNVACEDFDGDGLPDIMALVSQEHERVELLLNRGDKPWIVQTLWAAPDPAFGMSGMELVDFDQDGDTDVLFTNGDTFDSMTVKPSHGIQWLKNEGGLRFEYQRIADLSGVYRAATADFDRDGDLDLIASVWLPGSGGGDHPDAPDRAALVLFEHAAPFQFERHTLQTGQACFATLEVGDFDRDGDQDFTVSPHLMKFDQSAHGLVIWRNQTTPKLSRQTAP